MTLIPDFCSGLSPRLTPTSNWRRRSFRLLLEVRIRSVQPAAGGSARGECLCSFAGLEAWLQAHQRTDACGFDPLGQRGFSLMTDASGGFFFSDRAFEQDAERFWWINPLSFALADALSAQAQPQTTLLMPVHPGRGLGLNVRCRSAVAAIAARPPSNGWIPDGLSPRCRCPDGTPRFGLRPTAARR